MSGSTWVVGDIHGCAEELADLIERLALGADDRLLSVGDLYHRGPDPLGVARQLAALGDRFALVLGNHERAMLRRAGLAGERSDGSDAPSPAHLPERLEPDALLGDGRTPLRGVDPADAHELLALLVGRPYFLRSEEPGAWVAVHAGVAPGLPVERTPPAMLCSLRRLRDLPGAPYWYEVYAGPELVLFGHTPSPTPRARHARGRLVALGLDTGCVYGGALTAFRVEDEELEVVPARRAYTE